MLERFFRIRERGSTIRTEVTAGLVTFLTLSYIFFVQPALLSSVGMDFGSVLMAVAIASAFATFLMGVLANYPIALAPAMGHNFFFAFTVAGAAAIGGLQYPWQAALGANFISGLIFVILAASGIRALVIDAIPNSLKFSIAVGIGFLITLLGLEWGGIVVASPGTLVTVGDFKSPVVLLTFAGLLAISVMMLYRIRGAILIGIIVSTVLGILFGLVKYYGIASPPPSIAPTFLKLDPLGVFRQPQFLTVIFIFFFLDLFDNIGTLVGVAERGGFMVNGKIPCAPRVLMTDALGSVAGTMLGTSTVTSYIESTAGISEGGRTGLSNIVTGLLMLLVIFFYPLVKTIGGGVQVGTATYYPVIAPVLIIIGSLMIRSITKIDWEEFSEGLPAFLTIIFMQFAFSITEGISIGIVSYVLLKLLKGDGKKIHWLLYIAAALFLFRYIALHI